MGETATRTEDGLPKVYSSAKPYGMITFFTGASDGTAPGNGDRLLFSLTAADANQTVDLTFNEDVKIKDGYVLCQNAPFGAYVDITVEHPTMGTVAAFGRKIPICGTETFPLHVDDYATITQGLTLRITVYNANGTGAEDPATDFKVAGRIQLFRITTV